MSNNKNSKDHGIDRYHEMDDQGDTAAQLKSIYASWANTYDDDNDNKLKTVSQPVTVTMLARHCTDLDAQILDVGCGTGLVGQHLAAAGFTTFDGTDLSPEMLAHAEPRGYRNLFTLTAGQPLPVENDAYDIALCVGVFTHGHLGPDGITDILRITKPGGLVCFTVNEGVWEPEGFDEAIRKHTSRRDWQILEQKKQDYMVNENVQAWYIAAQKT